MNFKKSKDVKRASYYVWFLGSRESKGLRGDEYVSPVLNYMLDNECDLEPSKVTLQVSSKGLKIIQILTVPRKSSKLSADQQTQLFANSQRLKSEASTSSSLLKTEQVKHHIPHNSITWVYQEEDIICAILLLYNPITRCPVHVHAYRCDSIETADNLRQQLQALVSRPENQKKFCDIESRLAAKGLLLPASNHHFVDEEVPPETVPPFTETHHYNSASKTLNSDGRSTRTEGSDENSEESNSSDLGYAIRSKRTNHGYGKHIPLPPPLMLNPSKKSSKIKSAPVPVSKPEKGKLAKGKPKKPAEEPEVHLGATSALYDSLAAELRDKLGNKKMGPLLLPPRDYDSASTAANKEKNRTKQQMYLLTRSESSGKSSSGIGSDEALSSENQAKKAQLYRHYRERDLREPQSFLDIERHKRSNGYMFGDDEKPLYSLQMNTYSSNEEFGANDALEVDAEDIEEDVLFTANCNRKSKSTFDLTPKFKPPPHLGKHQAIGASHLPLETNYRRSAPFPSNEIDPYSERKSHINNLAKLFASNPNLSRAPLKEVKQISDRSAFVIGRREQRQQGHASGNSPPTGSHFAHALPASRQAKAPPKFFFADAEFSDPKPGHRLSSIENGKNSKVSNQRHLGRSSGNLANLDYNNSNGPSSLGYHQANQPVERSRSPQLYYSPRQETRYEPAPKSKQFVPLKSSSNSNRVHASSRFNENYDHELAMRKKLEQPFSRYSYIDVDHSRESRFHYVPPIRR